MQPRVLYNWLKMRGGTPGVAAKSAATSGVPCFATAIQTRLGHQIRGTQLRSSDAKIFVDPYQVDSYETDPAAKGRRWEAAPGKRFFTSFKSLVMRNV
jgi:hypothetical protein